MKVEVSKSPPPPPPEVPETLRSCSCISVEYAVVVTAIVPLAPNVTMTIPVVIQQCSSTVVY